MRTFFFQTSAILLKVVMFECVYSQLFVLCHFLNRVSSLFLTVLFGSVLPIMLCLQNYFSLGSLCLTSGLKVQAMCLAEDFWNSKLHIIARFAKISIQISTPSLYIRTLPIWKTCEGLAYASCVWFGRSPCIVGAPVSMYSFYVSGLGVCCHFRSSRIQTHGYRYVALSACRDGTTCIFRV